MIVLLVVLGVVLLLAIAVMVSYNRFVRQRNLVRESWRQVDVELQRRHDLIPNLVTTVTAYAAHERSVLESVVEARAAAQQVRQSGGGPTPQDQAAAENALSASLGRIFALAEAYPDLKSNQNFLQLQQELAESEDRIAAGRRFYNGNVRALNTRVESVPSNLVAAVFRFSVEQYFEVTDPAVRAVPQVDFGGIGSPGPASPTAPNS